MEEKEYIFNKKYSCPVCDTDFEVPTLKTAKARMVGQDYDLRPKFAEIEPLKYDVICCPRCRFAVLTKCYKPLVTMQKRNVCDSFELKAQEVPKQKEDLTYSYDDAIELYKIALMCSKVLNLYNGEKAYICLHMAWLLRSKRDYCEEHESSANTIEAIKQDEQRLLSVALDGFQKARSKESFPIVGMDESVVDYLIAALAVETRKTNIAKRYISELLLSKKASQRIKDKARMLKDLI